jgi:hypothetical protein
MGYDDMTIYCTTEDQLHLRVMYNNLTYLYNDAISHDHKDHKANYIPKLQSNDQPHKQYLVQSLYMYSYIQYYIQL